MELFAPHIKYRSVLFSKNSIKKFFIRLIPFRKLRRKLREQYFPRGEIKIDAQTSCLFVAPHPDDEMIGGGGLMCMFPENFDVVVMGSSGVAYQELSAEERATMRTEEFGHVMSALGIKTHWIFYTVGLNGNTQMDAYFPKYCNSLKTNKYDYIFLPVPHDRHPDHNYITNNLFKRILKKNEFKKELKIVFYEVWSLIPNPNIFIDITEVIDKKTQILRLYKSAHVRFQYADRSRDLNSYRGMQNNTLGYAEAFYVESIHNYLQKGYEVSLNG